MNAGNTKITVLVAGLSQFATALVILFDLHLSDARTAALLTVISLGTFGVAGLIHIFVHTNNAKVVVARTVATQTDQVPDQGDARSVAADTRAAAKAA